MPDDHEATSGPPDNNLGRDAERSAEAQAGGAGTAGDVGTDADPTSSGEPGRPEAADDTASPEASETAGELADDAEPHDAEPHDAGAGDAGAGDAEPGEGESWSGESADQPRSDQETDGVSAAAASHAPASAPGATRRNEPSERFTPKAPSGLSHLGKALAKPPTLRHFIVAVLLAVVGFGSVVQVRGDEADVLEGARRDELGRILVDLTRQGDRLEDEVRELEQSKGDLLNSSDSEAAAQSSAEERLQQLKVLTGEVPATGPGIVLRITGPVSASTLLTTVAELRAAGAEAIQITGDGGASVRVVVDTYFEDSDTDGEVLVSGDTVRAPYTILAIGDPDTLATTVEFPNGIRFHITEDGADVIVSESESLTIDTLHVPSEHEYARPAPIEEEE